MTATLVLPIVAAAVLGMAPVDLSDSAKPFPHEKHVGLFPCAACHAGVSQPGGDPFPDPTFCGACHDGSIQVEIDWTAPDPRPQTNPRFDHATHIEAAGNECADCHAVAGELPVAEQCRDCHGRAEGLKSGSVVHGTEFRNRHASDAAAAPETCGSCHIRADCLECHRPDPGSGSPGYHAANFLSEHATAAYTRSLSCSDCHNVRSFCAACHEQAGLTSAGGIGAGYHDAKDDFIAGHGQAARQSLESCVACHSENDCLRCHSTFSGGVNPHGPGFDADDLREKNPSMCAVCHGASIPEGG
jgi:hypothetical protein